MRKGARASGWWGGPTDWDGGEALLRASQYFGRTEVPEDLASMTTLRQLTKPAVANTTCRWKRRGHDDN